MEFLLLALFVLFAVNYLSYRVLNPIYAKSRQWDLNICCGKTDYGAINADIFQHDSVQHFLLIENIHVLPFHNKQMRMTLCAHTIEHIEDPFAFDAELRRVSQQVVYIVPPIWDLAAQLNFLEHKWIILSPRKVHTQLPRMVRNPLAVFYHRFFPQRIHA